MTTHLIDLASYQDGISLAAVKAAGFSKVNIKTSQGNWYTWAAAPTYADRARALGLDICTFHWLDNSASGAEQARIALGHMRRLGGPDGMAHQCDCEDTKRPATFTIWSDYVNAMQDGLGRHIANYTGDWWWPAHMGDRGAALTPYLWAAPNSGYLPAYPGDSSAAWRAGYGGWGDYSLLQYAVAPIADAGGGNLSKTAIRDSAVWAALTGTSGDDVTPEEHSMLFNADASAWGAYTLKDVEVIPGDVGGGTPKPYKNELAAKLDEILTAVTASATGGVDLDALAQKVSALLLPVVTAANAAAIADEIAKRLGNG